MKMKKTTPKLSKLVIAALRNLRDAHGSTAKEIIKYIIAEYNASEATVQRQLKTALKRGVDYGILKKTNTGYSLNTEAEVIGPLDMMQMESCGKKRKRNPCKPKRRCPKKRKRKACPRKRKACPKKRKKNSCNTCANRSRDCNQQPIQLVNEGTPGRENNAGQNEDEPDKRNSEEDEQDHEQDQMMNETHSRSTSRAKNFRNKSRSQSLARSKYSGSDMDDD